MKNHLTSTNQKFCKSLSGFTAIFTIVISSLVLAGWAFDLTVLKSITPNYVPMNPVTAVCFLLLGVSFLIHHFSYNTLRHLIAMVCAGLVLLVAVSQLGAIFFGFGFSPDQLLFQSQLGDNHMAFTTAFNFFLLSAALLTLRYPKNFIRQTLVILAGTISMIILVGYVYYVGALYQIPDVISMALNTAIIFFVFSCGVLCFEPDYGLMGILTDEGVSGVVSRQLLPGTIIALVVVGWVRLWGQRLGLYDLQMGILVHIFFITVILVVLIWRSMLILKRVDNERQEKEEKLSVFLRAVENNPASIMITDSEGGIEYVNPKFVDLTGYSLSEVIGKTPRILKSGKQSQEFYKNLWDTIKKGDVWGGEMHNKKKNGELYWESVSISSLKSPNGHITHFVGVKEDITERKNTEEKLQASETRYRRLFETAQDGILILDAESGKVIDVNPFLKELLGYSHEELLGKELWELGIFKDIADSKEAFLKLKSKGYVRYEDLPLQHKDGHRCDVEFVSNVYMVDHMKIIQCNIRDITERKKAQDEILEKTKELDRVNQELKQSDKHKDEFVSNVTHELRTPLAIIKESIALVYDQTVGPISAKQVDFLETARTNVNRLARMINNVLDYQKLDAQKEEFNMVEGNINDTIKEVGEDFKISLINKGLNLEFQLQVDLPLLKFDKDKIIQVLINLLNNAMKFTQKGTIALITQKEGDNAIRVSVKDEGIGVKEEDLDKLFLSFSQISSEAGYQVGGTGLGLALCKKIIENHAGKIGVVSEFGRGSTFYFILPIQERRVGG